MSHGLSNEKDGNKLCNGLAHDDATWCPGNQLGRLLPSIFKGLGFHKPLYVGISTITVVFTTTQKTWHALSRISDRGKTFRILNCVKTIRRDRTSVENPQSISNHLEVHLGQFLNGCVGRFGDSSASPKNNLKIRLHRRFSSPRATFWLSSTPSISTLFLSDTSNDNNLGHVQGWRAERKNKCFFDDWSPLRMDAPFFFSVFKFHDRPFLGYKLHLPL